jgi:magnesium chelatase family protein
MAYRRKLSGPLLDRIDLCVTVEHVEHDRLLEAPAESDYTTSSIRLVQSARDIQKARFRSSQKLNSTMHNDDIRKYAALQSDAKQCLDDAARSLDLSARSYIRCLKVARTIADLAGSHTVGREHVVEALRYRTARPGG